MGIPSQSYGASPAIRDHTLLPTTRHSQAAGTRFTYPGGWKAELTVLVIYRDGLPVRRQSASSSHLIAARPGVELTTFWPVHTVTPPSPCTNHSAVSSCNYEWRVADGCLLFREILRRPAANLLWESCCLTANSRSCSFRKSATIVVLLATFTFDKHFN